jgi:hypothetical protein
VCQFAAQPPPAKRQRRGTPKDSRTLTRFGQAVWAAVVPRPHHLRRAGPRPWHHAGYHLPLPRRGHHRVGRAEPAAERGAGRATDEGLSHVILDGKIVPVDREQQSRQHPGDLRSLRVAGTERPDRVQAGWRCPPARIGAYRLGARLRLEGEHALRSASGGVAQTQQPSADARLPWVLPFESAGPQAGSARSTRGQRTSTRHSEHCSTTGHTYSRGWGA